MDPLSHIIALLRPSAALSKPIAARGDWGVRYAAYGHPGFAMVLTGQCWLAVEGEEPLLLQRGDFVLLPSTPAFAMFSRPGIACVPAQPGDGAVRHGDPDGSPDFEMLGGAFRVEPFNGPLLVALLPGVIHVRAADGDTGRLSRIIDLIADESAADRPGREMILERLLEVMLVECLRWRGIGGGVLPPGLLSGMRDPALAKAIRAMHSDVRAGWTVAELARLAGMSRSAFSARFGETLGCAPIEYLTRWRMVLAQDALSRGTPLLDRLAEEIGYESASAFSTAFRRRVGSSPGAFARSRRNGDAVALRVAAA
ncbi:AraC family transcriptional regulator [Sphingomonas sp. JC676]|uniref:AraC family transcriptional regulator n=1 Tax=Sphingomonas sp. JC676 TaxID=2768065 RepID=UPI0016586F56|nr:AraC family transcriptional regulator [Sphingomonas sp. JC676]MBC9030878.1 AraC family transcriptional regulator [Sphingomonas sp. JC676]